MNRKMSWGIAALIIILIAAGGFIYWQWSQVQQLKEQLAQDDKMLEEKNKPKVQHAASTSDTKPPDEPGFVWVRHGDHWDKVPIELIGQQTPTVQSAQVEQPGAVQPKQHTTDASGEVIYPHHELLQTHPVAALRAQARDNGHWSAQHIPPFPPDDVEANELARNQYIAYYYESRNDFYNPIASKARRIADTWVQENMPSDFRDLTPRFNDLYKLAWIRLNDAAGLDKWAWEADSNFTREDYENANNQ